MSERHHFYQEFMSKMLNIIPQKAALANTITELLAIDKDAVYRRLRGDVDFSFVEMAIIARKLGISLNDIAAIDTEQCSSVRLALPRHIDPTETDYAMFEDYINAMRLIKDEPNTKIMECGNLFPHYLYYDYEYLTKVLTFRWSQSSFFGKNIPFHEVIIPERMRTLQKQACYYARHIKSTTYVWDQNIFEHFVSFIKFYAHVRLIKEEDVYLIKNDLIMFLSDIEKLTFTGKHADTGNEVSFFVGNLNAYSNFGFIESKNMRISQFRAFLLNAFTSFESLLFDEISSWLNASLKLTTLISVSGEKIRADFFAAQRKLIDTL